MEKTFKENLKKQLREHIRGFIKVHIVSDTLIIDIVQPDMRTWRYSLCSISAKLSTGLSSRIVAYVITKEYKKYILSQHFYTK